MKKNPKIIAVTGAGGQIAYQMIFKIAQGDLFGPDQPVSLHLLEIPEAAASLKGVQMELEDCAFPLLADVKTGSDPRELFQGIETAFLIGAKPRGPGMERKDLLLENAGIFVAQGKALNESAEKNAKVLIVGNPCNTNCLIALSHAPRIPKENFTAMTRLDHNRARGLLAIKAGVNPAEITQITIWGNHSNTQVPDTHHVKIQGQSSHAAVKDREWVEKEFIPSIQKRGAAVIAARGKSSAASAAHAAIESMRELYYPTPTKDWYSMGVFSRGNPYGVDEKLVFSFPCRTNAAGHWEIIPHLEWDEATQARIKASEKELIEERSMVAEKLGSNI